MSVWGAPVLVAVVTVGAAVLIQEPFLAAIGLVVAALGYSLNKAADK